MPKNTKKYNHHKIVYLMMVFLLFSFVFLVSCRREEPINPIEDQNIDYVAEATEKKAEATTMAEETTTYSEPMTTTEIPESTEPVKEKTELNENHDEETDIIQEEEISFNNEWEYGENSKIHSGKAKLYRHKDGFGNGITVCINAGHGTKGGDSVMTLCHPDGSPKVTGGSTKEGAIKAMAVSPGMTFPDGTPEPKATLSLARLVKKELLDAGYNVLMIRETKDVQLDNIARTLIANHYADCHIALHYDDSITDKGSFFISVPDEGNYRKMEPVASHWKQHQMLGKILISGIHDEGFPLYNGGEKEVDLTQTSYSTIPSIDLEVGDGGSDISEGTQKKIAIGICNGLNSFFEQ